MRLSEALAALDRPLQPRPGLGLPPDHPVLEWEEWLERWWRQSPTAICECSICGELRLTVGKDTKKCTRCKRGCEKCMSRPRHRWGCQHCVGQSRPLEIPFDGKRPRRRKVKIDGSNGNGEPSSRSDG